MNKIRTLVAGAVGAAVIVAGSVASSPAQAQGPSILDIVVGSLNDNPTPGTGTDNRWNDFDILANVVGALGLAETVGGLNGATAFAPADASFRGLVADLTNTPVWQLTEAGVLQTLGTLAGDPVIGPALKTTVLYHVSGENITDLFKRRAAIPTAAGEGLTIRPIPLRFSAILRDGDPTDANPFVVGGPIAASNGTVYVIAGVLRPIELKGLFPLD
jgi:uncharacterized surface protein with fasciclin (FAS1) repeats